MPLFLLQNAASFATMGAAEKETSATKENDMSYDILSILQEKDGTFSKGQRRIARYITEAYDR